MNSFLVLAGSLGLLTLSVLVLRASAAAADHASLVTHQLRFPAGLPQADVEAFIGSLSGLLRPFWRRWYSCPHVTFETVANAYGITQRLIVPQAWSAVVCKAMQAHLPGARFTEVRTFDPFIDSAISLRATTGDRSLRVDAPALSRSLLSTLQPLEPGQCIVVQWTLTPAGPVAPARTKPQRTPGREWWADWVTADDGMRPDSEATAALKTKQGGPLFQAVVRVGASTEDVRHAPTLLRQVESAWHATRAPGVHLRRRWVPKALVARSLVQRRSPLLSYPVRVNAQELSGLLGIPVEAEQIPGLELGGCRSLAASPRIPRQGLVLGTSTFPGSTRPVAIDTEAQLRHVHLMGPTGTGKTTAILNLIVQDMARGHGVTVIDGKGDLCDLVLARIPKGRERDVVYLNVADDVAPVGLNPLQGSPDQLEVKVEGLVHLLRSLFPQSWGPRLEQILRASLLTLGRVPGMTIVEVGQLLTNDGFRRRLVGELNDPVGLERFWAAYVAMSEAERAVAISPVLNKLDTAVLRPRLRRMIGQGDPKLNVADVVNEGKILLVNASAGLLGEGASNLVGSIVMAEIWQAATARVSLPAEQRRLHIAYLDECHHFLHLSTPIDTVLAEARGMGLGLVLAHQHLGQLPTATKDAMLSNCRSRLAYQCSRSDARTMAAEFGSGLTPEDLQGIEAYEAVAQVFAGGAVAPACTIATPPAPPETSDADAIRQMSRERYGRLPEEIDTDIRIRSTVRTSAPVGATKRANRRGGASKGGQS